MAVPDQGSQRRPKSVEVAELLKLYPTEISRDLSHYHNLRIRKWWRGKVSSVEVWSYIIHLDDESATKTAMREGDWSQATYIQARIANELMLSRADFAASHDTKMMPKLIESPAQIKEREENLELQHSLHDFLHAQMTGELVMPARDVSFRTDDTVLKRPEGVG